MINIQQDEPNYTSNITRDNHFISQVLLKNWSKDGIHIYTYQTLVPHSSSEIWKIKSLKGVAYQRDLYTVQKDGENDDSHEKWLAYEIESHLKDILEKIRWEKKLTHEEFTYLVKFLASHDQRTPSHYFQFQNFWNENADLCFERALKKFEAILKSEHPSFPKTIDNNFFSDKFKFELIPGDDGSFESGSMVSEISIGRKLWIQHQQYHLNYSIDMLLRHKWSIGRLSKKTPMFISDNPVIKMKLENSGTFHFDGGWLESNLIFLPLSPRHILFTVIGESYPDYIVFSTRESKHLQKLICLSTFRYIFSNDVNPFIPKIIPRIVDPKLYQEELTFWKNFHTVQIAIDQ